MDLNRYAFTCHFTRFGLGWNSGRYASDLDRSSGLIIQHEKATSVVAVE